MAKDKDAKLRRCRSRNSAGKRCKYDISGHPDQGGRPLHMRGAVTWNEPFGTRAHEQMEQAAAAFPGLLQPVESPTMTELGAPFSVVFKTKDGERHDLTDKVAGLSFGPYETAEARFSARDVEPDPVAMSDAEVELRGWWFDLAEREIEGTVPKAIEYSSTDLVDIGRTLAYCMGRQVSDEEAAELGIFFYMQGKLSRWAGAIKTGKRVSDDTLFDIGVYVRMTQRVRAAGGWPGIKLEDK